MSARTARAPKSKLSLQVARERLEQAAGACGARLELEEPWRHDVRGVFQVVAPYGHAWVDTGGKHLRLDWFGAATEIAELEERIRCGCYVDDEALEQDRADVAGGDA